jgi:glyoxylase-like metal-dependent hydrolase (beta-lactamase superfamily II)
MAARSLTVGTVQVTAHCDVTGDFPAPLADAFPQVPAAAWGPWRSRHPAAFGGPDRWRLRDWCFVVRSRDLVVLVDTGVGGPGVPGAGWIGTPGRLPDELADAGIEPDEIDLVVLTHLHLDHVGWNLAEGGDRPRFPRARYLVQRADWDLFAARPAETRVAFDRCVAPLQDLGVAELLDGDRALDAQLGLVHTPGHTPGSQSLLVRSGDDAALLWGDVANHPAQVGEPDWCPAADVDPDRARATRRRLLDQLESERMWLAPAHFPEPFGTVTRVDGARRWAAAGGVASG